MKLMNVDQICLWLIEHIAEMIGDPSTDISSDDDLSVHGLSSSEVLEITGNLEKRLDCVLPDTLLFDFPSIKKAAEYILNQVESPAQPKVTNKKACDEEPIAIIGMSCRFPGANDPEEFWQLLVSGSDAISEVPASRWDVDAYYSSVAGAPGKMNTRFGGFISDIAHFDADAFGISPREAERMDPQQRLMLEVAWEALEDAGFNRKAIRESETGVFIGLSNIEYLDRQYCQLDAIDPYAVTGNSASIVANRISYFFDLRGPSLTIDTACSSSLSAIHLACQSLRNGESKQAIVGAANLILKPEYTIVFSQAGLLSPDGRCYTFDARANGYVRGEGVGSIILKPLSKAVEDGDRVYCTIRGSSMNQDGRTLALTAPSRNAQEAMLASAYEAAGVSPGDIDYIEAHGTATAIGDVIEVSALSTVLRQNRKPTQQCLVGSVKTNIGHLEAAAGMAGVIKTVLAMKHRIIPPSINFSDKNPRIDFENSAVRVADKAQSWPIMPRLALAGVSGFGFGGTNVHVVLEEYNPVANKSLSNDGFHLFPLSARTPKALSKAQQVVTQTLSREDAPTMSDLAYTLASREQYCNRMVVVAKSGADFIKALETDDSAYVIEGVAPKGEERAVSLVFSGVGDHYLGMGSGLYHSEPIFQTVVDQCCGYLKKTTGLDLLNALSEPQLLAKGDAFKRMVSGDRDMGILSQTKAAQPAVFIIEYALYQLLLSKGVKVNGLIGYSLGEYVAATVAGVFKLEDALRVVARRAELINELPKGAMLAVPLSKEDVVKYMVDGVSIGIVNGPKMVVLSGEPDAIDNVFEKLTEDGVISRYIGASNAFHSALMEPVIEPLQQLLHEIELNAPEMPLVSNVSGTWMTDEQAMSPAYWANHLRQTVQFADGLNCLLNYGYQAFVEVGPGQSLSSIVRMQSDFDSESHVVVPSCRNGFDEQPDQAFFLRAVSNLWLAGVTIDFKRTYVDLPVKQVSMPSWLFDASRHWFGDSIDVTGEQRSPIYLKPEWQTIQASEALAEQNDLLIFVDSDGYATQLAHALKKKGKGVILVHQGDAFDSTHPNYTIRANEPDDYRLLFDQLKKQSISCSDIVYAWPLRADRTVQDIATDAFERLVHLVQSLPSESSGRLRLLTTLAHKATAQDIVLPASAMVVGTLHTLQYENPNWQCQHVDLALQQPIRLVTEVLVSEIGQRSVCIRGDNLLALSFNAVEPVASAEPAIYDGGVYVITGGTGGIGRALARQLQSVNKARVALVARSAMPAKDQWSQLIAANDSRAELLKILQSLEQAGGELMLVQADVTDAGQVAKAFNNITAHFGPIDGVIHAAGVAGSGLLHGKSKDQIDQILLPKTLGTDILLAEVKRLHIPRLVLCSSTVSTLGGGPGQTEYAAANAYMNALACREGQGKVISIIWGEWQWNAWSDGLSGFPTQVKNFLINNRKQCGLTDEQGAQAFVDALTMAQPQIMVCGTSVEQIRDDLAKLKSMIWQHPESTNEIEQKISPTVDEPVKSIDQLETTVHQVWQRFLGVKSLRPTDRFFDLGGTSLIGLQLMAELGRLTGVSLNATVLYEAPTVATMVQYLKEHGGYVDIAQNSFAEKAKSAAKETQAVTTENGKKSTEQATSKGNKTSIGNNDNVRSKSRDIAIVGMSGRFPNSKNVEQFWQNLVEGKEGISFLDDEQLLESGVSPEMLAHPNYVKVAGYIPDVDKFDAQFFGFPPREAELLDPQHRLFLECTLEALEDAGETGEGENDRIGLFGGANISTYMLNLLSNPELKAKLPSLALSIATYNDALTTKVSYKLNLKGPSVNVQTFCSTSAVATHMACNSLLQGDCNLAISGGSRIATPQEVGYLFEQGGIDSPDGHCRPFDKDGKGALLSNGISMVALKRLDDALADGNRIYAVIKGSAINNDGGMKTGYTAPSVTGQSQCIVDALRAADVDPQTIGYVEAHGTATELGDPVELRALTKAYHQFGVKNQYCGIGSVKSNVGHLDRAAGTTGLIKAALSLHHEMIPSTLHFEKPNPQLDLDNSPFFVNTELRPWKRTNNVRRAAVNAMGIGGTNAHIVLEEAPKVMPSSRARACNMLVLSAVSEAALDSACENLAIYLEQNPQANLSDVAYTLQIGRRAYQHRCAVVCHTHEEAIKALRGLAPECMLRDTVLDKFPNSLGMIFAGVGDHYLGMGAGLYRTEPEFRKWVEECCSFLNREMGLDLLDALREEPQFKHDDNEAFKRMLSGERELGILTETEAAQPAVFVLEYAMCRLLQSWGIKPDVLIGYSLGEYVAATIAGVFTLQEALRIVATRASLIAELPEGAMLGVSTGIDELEPYLSDSVSVGIINGPEMTVLSGEIDAIDNLQSRLESDGILSRRLGTSHAFHSAMMEPVVEELENMLAGFELSPPTIPILSNVTGNWLTDEEAISPEYWGRHMRHTVLFAQSLEHLLSEQSCALLEVGPGQSLCSIVRMQPQFKQSSARVVVPSCRNEFDNHSDQAFLLRAIAKLWLAGYQLPFKCFWSGERRARLSLPTYPFQRQRYWIDVPQADTIAGLLSPAAGKQPDPSNWFYKPAWQNKALDASTAVEQQCHLILADEQNADELVEKLREDGHTVLLAKQADEYIQHNDVHYGLNINEVEDYQLLLSQIQSQGIMVDQITFLSGRQESERAYYALIWLAKAIGQCRWNQPLKLNVVCSDISLVKGDEKITPLASTLLGPARVIPQEYPNVTCRTIDMEMASEMGSLVAELYSKCTDVYVAYRDGQRFVQTFVADPIKSAQRDEVGFKDKGVYLITGGLGGIGLIIARYLLGQFNAKVVLTGRTDLPARESWDEYLEQKHADDGVVGKIHSILALESLGGEVRTYKADVADEAAMTHVMSDVSKHWGKVDGVVHAAGYATLESLIPIQNTTKQDSIAHFKSKVTGTLVLDKLLQQHDVDFCLLFSSVSTVLGGFGFAAYCAANQYLDAFVESKRDTEGVRYSSIAWDSWDVRSDEELAQADTSTEPTIAQFAMTPAEGLDALTRAMASKTLRLIHSTGSLHARLEQWVSGEFLRAKQPKHIVQEEDVAMNLYQRPDLPTAYVEVSNETERRIAKVYRSVLGIDKIGVNDNFFDMGGTSLSAMQVAAQLQEEFGTQVSPVLLFDAGTISELNKHLMPNGNEAQQEEGTFKAQLQRRRELSNRGGMVPIAVIGMSGRFPGSNSVEQFWQNIAEGVEKISFFSDEELKEAGVSPSLYCQSNYIRARSILENVEEFDAAFFGYTPREAEVMDPQHRLFLECAWESLEDAGYDSSRYAGNIGVFAGANMSSYGVDLIANTEFGKDFVNLDNVISHDKDALCTKVSYKLDLRGPSVSVQTFCSTSLVAIHLACQSLRVGESDIAMAGGVSVRVPTKFGYEYNPGGQESCNGQTRSYDAGATGTIFGDGAAVVTLKRLEDALADGDQIHAVIRGSAINNDGAVKAGFTAPSVRGQSEVVASAMAVAEVEPEQISYVEGHGSATELGDPIEVAALNRAYRFSTDKRHFVALGSVKSNFGHLDRAAGATGFIKVVQSLKHEVLPPSLNFEAPNPEIDFNDSPFFVNTELRPWKRSEKPRIAGVNALGIGGTNAHVIVEEAPLLPATSASREWQMLTLSARTPKALDKMSHNLADYIETHNELSLADIAFTLQFGRKEMRERKVVICQSSENAIELLRGQNDAAVVTNSNSDKSPVTFIFPGVGEHYVNMGAQLYQTEPEFKAAMDKCFDWLEQNSDLDLKSVLFDDNVTQQTSKQDLNALFFRGDKGGDAVPSALNSTRIAQPAVFVVEYSLARLLISWGLVPEALVGYSVGEFAAATIAGTLSLENALTLVVERARIIDQLEPGCMLAVPAGEEQLRQLLNDNLSIAITNGSNMTVVAGSEQDIAALESVLKDKELFSRRLQTTHAFHSKMMEAACPELEKVLNNIELNEPFIPYLSNVSGDWITPELATDPNYWLKHMCHTVRFGEALDKLLSKGRQVILEVGPGQSLTSMVRQHPQFRIDSDQLTVAQTMRTIYEDASDLKSLLNAVAAAWSSGCTPDWQRFYHNETRRRVSLPTYPFERQRYWIDIKRDVDNKGCKIEDVGAWFYEQCWQTAAIQQEHLDTIKVKDAKWLVVGFEQPLTEQVYNRISDAGGKCVLITLVDGAKFAKLSECKYVVDADQPSQLRKSVAELCEQGFKPEHLLHCGSLTELSEFEAVQKRGFFSVLAMAQGLSDGRMNAPAHIDVVSSDLYMAVGQDNVVPAKFTNVGAYRTIPQEFPNITVRGIDFVAGQINVDEVMTELLSTNDDVAVAYRQGKRYVQSYVSCPLQDVRENNHVLRQGGNYLITGGLGNVGMNIASMLSAKYQANVALLSRRPFPAQDDWDSYLAKHGSEDGVGRQIARLREVNEAGGNVFVVTGDIADEPTMTKIFADVEQQYGKLNGLFHAAGVITAQSHAVILEVDRERSEAHFLAKVAGTQVIERLIAERELDFCMLFSSLAATLGGMQLSMYAAANSYEDGVAFAHRNDPVTRWVAVNWDSWARENGEQDHEGTTLEEFLMLPEEGVDAVCRILSSSKACHLVNSTADLYERLNQWVYRKRMSQVGIDEAERRYYARPELSTTFIAANNQTEKRVARVMQNVLGIDQVGLDDNYFELGGNSLISMQVIAELQREFDVSLSPVLLFEAPSVSELSKRLGSDKDVQEQSGDAERLQQRRRNARAAAGCDDIAVIGFAGRFPGAKDVDTMWDNLVHGRETISTFTDEELLESGISTALVNDPNYVKKRGILDNIDMFDAGVFGFNPREAELIDPQHRVMLEVAWATMEHAGYDSHRFDGLVGVFAGTTQSLYQMQLHRDKEVWAGLDRFETNLGNTQDSLSTRISYKLNLSGPSLSIGTYCSTSGVSIHLACQSLRTGESDMALAGGVSVLVPNKHGYLFEPNNQGSPDGHTRTFDARGQGTVFSDGCAMLLLKRLTDAQEDGDTIHAVIKGSAINNDGSLKAGFTAPSVERQSEVIVRALEDAQLTPEDINYIEAHGTATELGDPIEVAALTRAYRQFTDRRQFVTLGSIKTNFGHTDRAAGAIGMIKAINVLRTGVIPPTLHFEKPNPKMDLENSPFKVRNVLYKLPESSIPLRAAVTTLGVGGTNAHIILEQAPKPESSVAGKRWQFMTLSAKTSTSLEAMRENLANALAADNAINLADAAYTLHCGRREFGERLAVVGRSHKELIDALRGDKADRIFKSVKTASKQPVAFMFTGVGDQYVNMAGDLYREEEAFRNDMEYCFEVLADVLDTNLRDVLFVEDMPSFDRAKAMMLGQVPNDEFSTKLNQTVFAQPCTFIVQYCFANHLIRNGIVPEAVVGYSLGEYTAATLAGILSLEDALKLVAERAKLINSLPGGSMLAVPLSIEELRDTIEQLGQAIDIGIVNGPKLTIASGSDSAIEALEQQLSSQQVMCRRLLTTHAFHSSMMAPVKEQLAELVREVEFKTPTIRFLSNVTGSWLDSEHIIDEEYWVEHTCQTARFGDCIDTLLADGNWALVEVGPGQSLTSLIKQRAAVTRDGSGAFAVQTMRTVYVEDNDVAIFTAALAKLWVLGCAPAWHRYYEGERRHRIPLPGYAYDRQSYWIETAFEHQESLASQLLMSQEPKYDLADSFFFPLWARDKDQSNEVAESDSTAACWLVFADNNGVCDRLIQAAEDKGIDSVLVYHGERYQIKKDGSFVVRAANKKDLDSVFKQLKQDKRLPNRIVYGWTLESWDDNFDIQIQMNLGFYTLFQLAKTIGERMSNDELHLCILSSDMQPALGVEAVVPSKALIKGPVKVIRQEFANVICRNIDVVSEEIGEDKQGVADRLLAELLNKDDQYVALRGNERLLPVIEPIHMDESTVGHIRLKDGGVYLITGGMGGIGLAVAEYLHQTQNAKLVLLGRSSLPEQDQWDAICESGEDDRVTERVMKINALVKAGAEVMVATADVADEQAMKDIVAQTVTRFGTLDGVIHAAGVPGQGLTQLKPLEAAEQTLRSKVQGTLALAKAVEGLELDFMILVSSIAAFTGGGPGQIDYCAGNAFLDAYAQANHYKHGATIAINFGEWQWDAWSEGLQGYQPELRAALIKHRQEYGITFDEGMEAIRRILSIDVPQVIFLPEDAVAMIARSNVCMAVDMNSAVNNNRKKSSYPRPALSTDFVAATSELESKIAAIWQNVLGIDEIGTDDNFFDLGGNSLVGLQVVAELRKEFDAELTPVVLYEAPTVAALAIYLVPEQAVIMADDSKVFSERREKARQAGMSNDIAIVGMSGRFPGANNVREFWQNLKEGVEASTVYTEAEMLAAGVNLELIRNPAYVNVGYDVEDFDHFDARLFGYAPREVEFIDPQHRQFLLCAWEALEDAGCDPETYKGLIGVYGGANTSLYLNNLLSRPDITSSGSATWQAYFNNSNDSLATRVSYKLNLKGPAMSIQTFCSTSGVAMHMACKSLLAGECDVALGGGVSISVRGKTGYLYEEGGIDSPDGHIRTFDADAKGAVIGDGVGIVALKRLDDAIADGDHIYAVIKGSAVNNDGSVKVGYTAPSVDGQVGAISEALAASGIGAETIQYVEAHGTATELGDPIEVTALSKAYRNAGVGRKSVVALGSVKPNTGHLDRAAGVTGMIKTVLSLSNEEIPRLLHYKSPNPNLDLDNSPFFVADKNIPWARGDTVRRAAVNVVGLGGTNAHFVLEEAPQLQPSDDAQRVPVLMLSANSQWSLDMTKKRLAEHLRGHPQQSLADVAYTLQLGRKRLPFRYAVVADDYQSAIDALTDNQQKVMGARLSDAHKTLVFMFPGVGDHYHNMAFDLYHKESSFREEFNHCCDVLEPLLGVDLRDKLFDLSAKSEDNSGFDLKAMLGKDSGDEVSQLQQTWLAQPLVFAVEYCLAHLLMTWGYMPHAMVGYSLGEFVAATISGCLSLEDALTLVAKRARLINDLPGGSMLAVPMSEQELEPLMGEELSVALCNSPKTSVVAGSTDAIMAFAQELESKDIVCRVLGTSHAFHSPMMESARVGLRELLEDIELNTPTIPYVSNLTGDWVTDQEVTSVDYWLDHMCQTVRFADGIGKLLEEQGRVLVEVGPGQSLGSFVKQHPLCTDEKSISIVSTLRASFQNDSDDIYLQNAVARMWLAGVEPQWNAFYGNERRLKVSLPTYAFERNRYWVEAGAGSNVEQIAKKNTDERVSDIGQWFYQSDWLPKALRPSDIDKHVFSTQICCLILDEGEVGKHLSDSLKRSGGKIITVEVRAGQALEQVDEYTYRLDGNEEAQMVEWLETLKQLDMMPDRIVHMGTLTQERDFAKLQELGFFSLIQLAQTWGKTTSKKLQLDVVSSGLYMVRQEDDVIAGNSTLLGACRSIPQEYTNISVRNVDVEYHTAATLSRDFIDSLVKELSADTQDVSIAWRDTERLVQSYTSIALSEVAENSDILREQGTYLITGGLGNVGLTLAGMLTKRYNANVALLSRRSFPAKERWDEWLEQGNDEQVCRIIRAIRRKEQEGGSIMVVAADVADKAQMGEAFKIIESVYGDINGVFHAAGLNTDESHDIIADITRERSEAHFAAKVHGTVILSELLDERNADFCLLFSSLSATLGGLRLAMYSAANAYEDGFAMARRNDRGTRWIAVNWDTWAAEDGPIGHQGTTLEKFLMWPNEGAEAVRRVLSVNKLCNLVNSTANLHARLEQWVYLKRKASETSGASKSQHLRPELSTSYVAANNQIEKRIAAVFERVLGIDKVGLDDNYFELGGNSLISMQLISELQREFEVSLSPILIFEAPSVSEMAKKLGIDDSRGDVVDKPLKKKSRKSKRKNNLRKMKTDIESMSEEQVQQLLERLDSKSPK
ncbi:type I polyketide synthase [Idiomarina xiamenensis]|uniref:Beta-ketoacyl synthase n=1 Tax=Idiomarina xiamenensis 10-D-4 TaxID=740709 RepID=K2JC32_9GAMM|nr:type I polyketide synthase [Idiomarina xiamenensis]EKE80856.1 beta-ketoacyl synthase [Idiomarina xiamenensis 10-D-4]